MLLAMRKNAAISPLKGRLHRLPGTSVRKKLLEVLLGKGVTYILVGMSGLVLACLAWIWYLTGSEPTLEIALFLTVMALMLAGVGTWKFRNALAEGEDLALARDGEVATGQALEKLRSAGYDVFHDIPADGFNIDHVLIGATGIYAIETKTRRKPRPDARVSYNEEKVWVDGHEPDRNPVTQAKAQADWVREKLKASTGIQFPVRPVVVYTGWYVEQPRRPWQQYVWVLTEKHLPAFLEHQRAKIKMPDVHLAKSRVAELAKVDSE